MRKLIIFTIIALSFLLISDKEVKAETHIINSAAQFEAAMAASTVSGGTIELRSDISLEFGAFRGPTIPEGDGNVIITTTTGSTITMLDCWVMSANVTFDNVKIRAGLTGTRDNKGIYAQGHTLKFTENVSMTSATPDVASSYPDVFGYAPWISTTTDSEIIIEGGTFQYVFGGGGSTSGWHFSTDDTTYLSNRSTTLSLYGGIAMNGLYGGSFSLDLKKATVNLHGGYVGWAGFGGGRDHVVGDSQYDSYTEETVVNIYEGSDYDTYIFGGGSNGASVGKATVTMYGGQILGLVGGSNSDGAGSTMSRVDMFIYSCTTIETLIVGSQVGGSPVSSGELTLDITNTTIINPYELGTLSQANFTYHEISYEKITYVMPASASNDPLNPEYLDPSIFPFTLQSATLLGHEFLGWYKEDTYQNEVTEINSLITEAITLYAKFRAYTITYLEGEKEGNPVDASELSTTQFTLLEPSKTGYDFIGWFDGDSKVTSLSIYDLSADITLTARWDALYVVVTFELTDYIINPVQLLAGEVLLSPSTPISATHEFAGWFTEDSYVNEWDFLDPVLTDMVLYGKWIEISDPNRLAAQVVVYEIDKIGKVTYAKIDSIEALALSYDGLNASVKQFVTNYAILEAALARIPIVIEQYKVYQYLDALSYPLTAAQSNLIYSAADALAEIEEFAMDEELETLVNGLYLVMNQLVITDYYNRISLIGEVTLAKKEMLTNLNAEVNSLPVETKAGILNLDVLIAALARITVLDYAELSISRLRLINTNVIPGKQEEYDALFVEIISEMTAAHSKELIDLLYDYYYDELLYGQFSDYSQTNDALVALILAIVDKTISYTPEFLASYNAIYSQYSMLPASEQARINQRTNSHFTYVISIILPIDEAKEAILSIPATLEYNDECRLLIADAVSKYDAVPVANRHYLSAEHDILVGKLARWDLIVDAYLKCDALRKYVELNFGATEKGRLLILIDNVYQEMINALTHDEITVLYNGIVMIINEEDSLDDNAKEKAMIFDNEVSKLGAPYPHTEYEDKLVALFELYDDLSEDEKKYSHRITELEYKKEVFDALVDKMNSILSEVNDEYQESNYSASNYALIADKISNLESLLVNCFTDSEMEMLLPAVLADLDKVVILANTMFTVKFTSSGTVVLQSQVKYGQLVTEIPEVPVESNQYGIWDFNSKQVITSDIEIDSIIYDLVTLSVNDSDIELRGARIHDAYQLSSVEVTDELSITKVKDSLNMNMNFHSMFALSLFINGVEEFNHSVTISIRKPSSGTYAVFMFDSVSGATILDSQLIDGYLVFDVSSLGVFGLAKLHEASSPVDSILVASGVTGIAAGLGIGGYFLIGIKKFNPLRLFKKK